jgi:hypothetical protein
MESKGEVVQHRDAEEKCNLNDPAVHGNLIWLQKCWGFGIKMDNEAFHGYEDELGKRDEVPALRFCSGCYQRVCLSSKRVPECTTNSLHDGFKSKDLWTFRTRISQTVPDSPISRDLSSDGKSHVRTTSSKDQRDHDKRLRPHGNCALGES